MMQRKIDHLGIAVKDLTEARRRYEMLGFKVSGEEVIAHEKVRVAMVELAGSRFELLEATSEDSVIAKFVAKRGEGLHHVAVHVDDLEAAVAEMKRNQVRLVKDAIQIGAGGHKYVFIHPASAGGVLLELCQDV